MQYHLYYFSFATLVCIVLSIVVANNFCGLEIPNRSYTDDNLSFIQ